MINGNRLRLDETGNKVLTEGNTRMSSWPAGPSIYEINALVWVRELSRKYGREVTLANVPAPEWDWIAEWGFDGVWLMGVWERSPEGIRIALGHPGLRQDYTRALPDWTDEDVVGSPYCIRRYEVDPQLGGRAGLAAARAELAARGLRLLLDFVPNHTAIDHPWVDEHPEYYVQGSAEEGSNRDYFFERGGHVFACGRDPYFPAWTDVAQLNAFSPGLRDAVIATVKDIASQCDGVRCDMAMLLISDIFARTWGDRPGPRAATEYWRDVIGAVKADTPGFLFIAEAYWDLEWELQQQGFDHCYDKRLYDRMEHSTAGDVRGHLWADLQYQNKLIRFLENHDEPRAAATFAPDKHRAAAVAIATLPGAKLWHEGQFEGKKVRLPVQLGRRPDEPVDEDLLAFYRELLMQTRDCRGEWALSDEGDGRVLAWNRRDGARRMRTMINWSGDYVRDLAPWSAQVLKALVATGG